MSLPLELLRTSLFPYLAPADRLYLDRAAHADAADALRRAFLARYPERILSALGGVDRCVTYGFVRGTPEMVGGTDYIDSVHLSTLPDARHPVYFGVDNYRRPFAILRYWYARASANAGSKAVTTATAAKPPKPPKEVVVTLFQRYTDGASWCFGTCYPHACVPGNTYVNDEELTNVQRLLAGEHMEIGWRDDSRRIWTGEKGGG